MPIKLITPASVLPVPSALAMKHLRVNEDEADLVGLYLQAATDMVEDYTGRSLITKGYQLQLDSWPNYRSFWPTFRGYVPSEVHPLSSSSSLRGIELRRTPLAAVTSVQYWSPTDTSIQTWDTANYQADLANTPGKVVFLGSEPHPDLVKRPDAVQINFTAGYGSSHTLVPAPLQMAILFWAQQLYDNRVPVANAHTVEAPLSLRYILRAFRVESLTQEK